MDRDLSKLEYWVNSVHARAPDSPIFLVGTHYDAPECTDEYVNYTVERIINTIRPGRFRNSEGNTTICGLFSVSSKDGRGIPELMTDISNTAYVNGYDSHLFPLSWLNLRTTLGKLSAKAAPFLNWQEFEGISLRHQLEKENIVKAAEFFHCIGVVCYFGDHPKLRDFVFLNPQYLTNVMSAIITVKHRYTKGTLTSKDFDHIWREFPSHLHSMLLSLLERFEIIHCLSENSNNSSSSNNNNNIEKPKEHKYLIPSLLSEQQPELSPWTITMNKSFCGLVFCRNYFFSFLPLGFFSRLLIRNLHLSDFESVTHWKNGQLLRCKDVLALLRFNPSTYVLYLQIHGDKADINYNQYNLAVKMLRLLTENIHTTIEPYNCSVKISVPCSHCISIGYSQWEFPLEDCLDSDVIERGYVLCGNVRRIRLDILAPDVTLADLQQIHIPFDEITMESVIGYGSFGVVFKGEYLGTTVAVKQLLDEDWEGDDSSEGITASEETQILVSKFQEFKRELWLMSCLNHNNLCELVGLCLSPLSMVMEYMPKGDLFNLISKEPDILSDYRVKVRIAYDIAQGMAHLHSYTPPIAHRDLRSPNVFISSVVSQINIIQRLYIPYQNTQ